MKRTAFAEEPGTTVLAIGGTPGQAYEAHGYELWSQVQPLFAEGRYEEAADRGRELVAAHPEYPMVTYNVACSESLAGRKEDAIGHLRQAIELSEQFRSMAAEDSGFNAIREEPAFQELVGRA